MIFAEINGKLGVDSVNAHERSEDLLTSTAFGLLQYIPLRFGLLALLDRAKRVEHGASGVLATKSVNWIDTHAVTACEIQFWPFFDRYGEPDLLLRLTDAEGALVHICLIEVKLYSPKSGAAHDPDLDVTDIGDADASVDSDQLVKYWHGLKRLPDLVRGVTASLIYLTAHSTAPIQELRQSIGRVDGEMRLGWLSWFDVFEVVRSASERASECRPAGDLARLLSHKGFEPFHGFHSTAMTIPSTGSFWTEQIWFDRLKCQAWPTASRDGLFWRNA